MSVRSKSLVKGTRRMMEQQGQSMKVIHWMSHVHRSGIRKCMRANSSTGKNATLAFAETFRESVLALDIVLQRRPRDQQLERCRKAAQRLIQLTLRILQPMR